ncbi:MAG: Tic20 family protein [Prochlorococcaceae cyanobacterium]
MSDSPIWQRLLAALAYLLPWADAVEFGRSLFNLVPQLQWLVLPALPVLQLQLAIPFGSLALFLLLYLGVVRNERVPYLVRFNVLQAILIDIVLVVLGLVFRTLLVPLGAGFALRTLSNTVFLGTLAVVLFAVVQVLRGKEAEIPTLSEAVRMQLP